MEMDARMLREPQDALRFVSAEIVEDTWISRPGYAATTRFMKCRNSTRRRR
jgi:hypothetical protein